MTGITKSDDIGLGQAHRLCNMPADNRLKFIAEGLPLILESARSLMKASRSLKGSPREAEILERHAVEECAKILILMDVIRCPKKIISSLMGKMMKWFYDHLARLIYADAQGWKPMHIAQLQEYVDNSRKSHYLEGEYSEYIMPNWELFNREMALYVDVMCDENAEPSWCSPLATPSPPELFGVMNPVSYEIAEGLEAMGAFTKAGLRIVHDVWGSIEFVGDQDWSASRDLLKEMWNRLDRAGLMTDRLTETHAHNLVNNWQLPMYHIEFSPIPVTLENLRERRERDTPYW